MARAKRRRTCLVVPPEKGNDQSVRHHLFVIVHEWLRGCVSCVTVAVLLRCTPRQSPPTKIRYTRYSIHQVRFSRGDQKLSRRSQSSYCNTFTNQVWFVFVRYLTATVAIYSSTYRYRTGYKNKYHCFFLQKPFWFCTDQSVAIILECNWKTPLHTSKPSVAAVFISSFYFPLFLSFVSFSFRFVLLFPLGRINGWMGRCVSRCARKR